MNVDDDVVEVRVDLARRVAVAVEPPRVHGESGGVGRPGA